MSKRGKTPNKVTNTVQNNSHNESATNNKNNLQQPTEMYQPVEVASKNTNVNPEDMPEIGC